MTSQPNPLLQKQHAQHYQEQQITTASKEQLLIMLYDGAIRFCKVAKKAMLENNIEKSNHHLIRAQRIIMEFMGSLDLNVGGETAKQLFVLYEYLHHQLVQANVKKETALIDEVIEHLSGLRQTWVAAIEITKQEQAHLNRPTQV
jgi:flagellar protein FliS